MVHDDTPEIPTDTIAETDNYSVWVAEEPDGETTYHLELGPVTAHFFAEEWDEFVELIKQAAAEPIEISEEEAALDVELDWGSLYFSLDEWKELLSLIKQVEE
jgi:hypothetical protein